MRPHHGAAQGHNQPLDKARDAAALVALALVTVVFFWPVVFAGFWLPHGGGDLASFLFPMYRFIAHEFARGEIPLWNPHQYAGAPLVGDNQAGLFYPPNLALFLVWPDFPYLALEGMVIAHVWWAGAAFYLMLRGWFDARRLSRAACLVGAVAFMLNDVFITHLGNLNLNAALSWLPLALLGMRRATSSASLRASSAWMLLAVLALGCSLLAGHGQGSFLLTFGLVVYALQAALIERRWTILLACGLVVVLGCGIAAVSLLPTMALLPLTVRANMAPAELARYSLVWPALTGLWAPGLFGRGSQAFWGWWERVEVGYLGVLPWLLALVALARWPRRVVLFPLLTAALGLLMALGPNAWVHLSLVGQLGLPFRAAARFLVLVALGVAMLASLGADWLFRSERPRLGRLLALASVGGLVLGLSLIAIVAGLSLRYPERERQMMAAVLTFALLCGLSLLVLVARQERYLGRRGLATALVGLLLADLVSLGSRIEVDQTNPVRGFERWVALAYLKDRAGLDRIETATPLWQPAAAQLHGLFAIDGVYNPLALGIYAYYMDGLRYRGSPTYDLLGARYVIAAKGEPPSDQPDIQPLFDGDPAVTIYENRGALSRLRFVTSSEIIANEAAAYARLHDAEHDAHRSVVLLSGQPERRPPGGAVIEDVIYQPNEIRLTLRSSRPGYLVLSDIYHPGWRARLDGRRVPILRADFAFRAVSVPAGEHDIRMWYEPPLWHLGIAVSLLSLGLTIGGLGWWLAGIVMPRRGMCRPSLSGGIETAESRIIGCVTFPKTLHGGSE